MRAFVLAALAILITGVATLPVHAQALMTASPTVEASPSALYARYTPYPCAVIAGRVGHRAGGIQRLTWRDRWPDTTTVRADSGAVKPAWASELRACLAPYTVEGTPPRQLFGVGLAWLAAGEDAQAEVVFRRVLAASAGAPVAERAWVLSKLVEVYAGADSARLRKALLYMAQLDALGKPAAGRRLAMRNALYGVAQEMDSIPFMVDQAQAALRTSHELSGDAAREWVNGSVTAVMNQADVEARRGNFGNAVAILKRALDELVAIDPRVRPRIEQALVFKYNLYGKPARPLQATFVYTPGHSAPTTTIARPTRGRVSLFVFSGYHAFDLGMPLFASTQSLIAKAGSKVEVTLVSETTGFDQHRLIPKPEDEAPRIQEFFHSYLKIPATLVVWALPVVGKAQDGRVLRGQNPNWMLATTVLIDKNGLIRNIDDGGEMRMLHMVDELSR